MVNAERLELGREIEDEQSESHKLSQRDIHTFTSSL